MKFFLITIVTVLFLKNTCLAQSAPAINSSYTTQNSSLIVYPYDPASGKPDTKIHFFLNANTKFYISKIMDSGYVIRVWYFPDKVSKKDSAGKKVDVSKKDFYKKLFVIAQVKNTLSLAIAHQDSLLHVDSIVKKIANVNNEKSDKADVELKKAKSQLEASKKTAEVQTKKNKKAKKNINQNNDNIVQLNSLIESKAKDVSLYKSNVSSALDSSKKVTDKIDDAKKIVAKVKSNLARLEKSSGGQSSSEPSNDTTIYRIYKATTNTYTDTLLYKSQSPAAAYDSLAFVDSWGNYMEFFLPLKNFSDCVLIYPHSSHFTWGFLSVPLKIRIAPFSFTQNVNFGLTLGWKFQPVSTVNVAHDVLMGISVGSVNLKTTTTLAGTTTTQSVISPTTSAVSLSVGYMFQYDKFQAGAFIGWDIAGNNRSEFVNGGTPWFGIAIGLSLFGENSTTAGKQTQD